MLLSSEKRTMTNLWTTRKTNPTMKMRRWQMGTKTSTDEVIDRKMSRPELPQHQESLQHETAQDSGRRHLSTVPRQCFDQMTPRCPLDDASASCPS
jgi:hypothetical protein